MKEMKYVKLKVILKVMQIPVLPFIYGHSALILQNCFLKSVFFRNFAPDEKNVDIFCGVAADSGLRTVVRREATSVATATAGAATSGLGSAEGGRDAYG
jgi:hypothetical protein